MKNNQQPEQLNQISDQINEQPETFSKIGEVLSQTIRRPTTQITRSDAEKNGYRELVESELAECEGCTGEKCRKANRKFQVPTLFDSDDGAAISYTWCKWRPQRNRCKHALIPLRYANKTLVDYEVDADNEKAVNGAKWFLAQNFPPTKGLYLYGECGTGKTFLAALIAREYVLRSQTVIFGDVPSLLEDLKATFDKGGTDALLDRYCDCDLLILDDLGAGKITDWSVGVLYQIINARYNSEKPIIATSNYDFKGLAEALSVRDQNGRIVDALTGKRIVSRLREITFSVSLGENDRREN